LSTRARSAIVERCSSSAQIVRHRLAAAATAKPTIGSIPTFGHEKPRVPDVELV
jgi:hypothetical protein